MLRNLIRDFIAALKARLYLALLVVVGLFAVVAFATGPTSNIFKDSALKWFAPGVYVGSGAAASTANRLSTVLGTSATVDFVFTGDGGTASQCTDSSNVTMTGALLGDACLLGMPYDGGTSNGLYSCYVAGTNVVRARHCSSGSVWDDPGSSTFYFRVLGLGR